MSDPDFDLVWGQTRVHRKQDENARNAAPRVRLWNGEYELQHVLGNEYKGEFSFISNDTGTGRIELPADSPAALWVHDHQGRIDRGEGRNVHITVDHVGARWSELDPASTAVGTVNFAPVGRALIMGKNRGILKVYADNQSGRLLGSEMACPKGENLAHLLAWSIQQELTVGRLLQMPFYHPVIEEALQAALYDCYSKVESKNSGGIAELVPLA